MVRGGEPKLLGVSLHLQIKTAVSKALGITSEARQEPGRISSGSSAQIIQSTFDQAFRLLSPRLIVLLVEELNSGRMFRWQGETHHEEYCVVNSEEFDSTADEYQQMMPTGDWILRVYEAHEQVVSYDSNGRKLGSKAKIPGVILGSFGSYTTVMSVHIDLGDEWRGRFVICDPSIHGSSRATLTTIRRFAQTTARSIHSAHLCLRACRETAAEERARLARELHDGTIQSMLGVELRLESLKHRLDPAFQKDLYEVQQILRREATELRNMVNDSRRRALRPERLLEFVSDRLERFQRDTGVVTRFFADLHNDHMPPRICHEIARMTEEGITNAQKHSGASTLTVRVGSVDDNWILVMVDDGVGFDFRGAWPLERLVTSGLGPRVIKERVLALAGGLMIESTPTGARIEISIPKAGCYEPVSQTNPVQTEAR